MAAGDNITIPLPLPANFSDRWARLRSTISPGAKILEIGGSYNPIARRSEGFDTFTVDHASREDLLVKYRTHFNDPQIEHVDFICHDSNIAGAIPAEHHGTFDVCLVSHVIEHMTNPIMFLQSIERLLKPEGVFTMAVPDKRGCFDFFRPITTTGTWLLANIRKASVHSAVVRFDFSAYTVARDGVIVWPQTSTSDFSFASHEGLHSGYSTMLQIGDAAEGEYFDTHSWVFVPSSFALLIYELHALGLIGMTPHELHTGGNAEFFVDLRKDPQQSISDLGRMRLLKQSAQEQAAGFSLIPNLG